MAHQHAITLNRVVPRESEPAARAAAAPPHAPHPSRKRLSRSCPVGCNQVEMDDAALLHEYHATRSNDAFRRVVERHVDWVYAIVRRQVRDSHLAHDVTQGVFLALAQKAGTIRGEVSLGGWLFRAAQFGAKGALRMERRRRFHESRAAAVARPEVARPEATASVLAALTPPLEDAMGRLKSPDRDALLLRFYQQKSHHEVGRAMGISEEAAKKRVARAVDRLREILRRRGVTIETAGGLVSGLEQVVGRAPEGLTAAVVSSLAAGAAGAAGGAGAFVALGIAKEITRMIAIAKAKLAAVCATVVVGVGVGGTVALAAAWGGGGDAPSAVDKPNLAAASGGRGVLQALTRGPARAELGANVMPQPPLIEAAQKVDVAQVRRLLGAGADANVAAQAARTSLHEVVQTSWPPDKTEDGVAIVKLLLEKGADPMAVDEGGWTAIEQHGAKNEPAVAVIRQHLGKLLKNAKPDAGTLPALVPGATSMSASQQGDLIVFKLRLARGADPNGADKGGRPLLHEAVLWNRRELVDLLLDAGANVNLPDRTTGDTPLHIAVTFEKHDTARYLMQKGADPFRSNGVGQSPVSMEGDKREHKLFDAETIKTEKADASAWGPSLDGVQARLRRTRETWKAGEQATLRLDVQNHWNRKLTLDLNTVEVVVDGTPRKRTGEQRDFGPDVWVTDVPVPLGELPPGQHRVKVKLKALAKDGKKDLTVETTERVVVVR